MPAQGDRAISMMRVQGRRATEGQRCYGQFVRAARTNCP